MTQQQSAFDSKIILTDVSLQKQEKSLLGFSERYTRINQQLRLLLSLPDLAEWNRRHYGGKLALCDLVAQQYPLVIFHGDVGTGKTATAECIANRLAGESRTDDPILFKMSSRVRGSGRVGEMGTLLTQAFQEVTQAAGKSRRAFLIIDEADSLGASRAQEHSHHEDKVAVNTLIQCIDDLRKAGGRIVVFLCTNRLSVLDPALRRRAAIVEEFARPNERERRQLFEMDLAGVSFAFGELDKLVALTGPRNGLPGWTYSDLRTRLYPAAVARAFPERALAPHDLLEVAMGLAASPVLEDL